MAAAVTPPATYSATGVCVAGSPKVAFTIYDPSAGHVPEGFTLSLFNGTTSVATTQVGIGNVFSSTIIWNTPSSLSTPGPHVVAVNRAGGGSGLAAENLTASPAVPNGYTVVLPQCGPNPPTFVGMVYTPDGRGYWQATTDGQVLAFGDAKWSGSMSGEPLNHPIVGIAPTPDGNGYWLVASDGGVFAFGDAQFYGSTGSLTLNQPVVGMARTASGLGYWLVASDGGVFAYGDAAFLGSMGSVRLNEPVVGIALDPGTNGYWLAASDGGVFSFGAPFLGSMGGVILAGPVVGIEAPSGDGYWLIARDGGVFTFGTIGFFLARDDLPLTFPPVVAMAAAPGGIGYAMLNASGDVAAYFGFEGGFGSIAGAQFVT